MEHLVQSTHCNQTSHAIVCHVITTCNMCSRTYTPFSKGNGPSDSVVLSHVDMAKFRPTGHIFAQSHEHKRAINEMAAHESYSWFVTGSNDSTIKLWDLRGLDRDISLISKVTYPVGKAFGLEEKITSVTILSTPQLSSVIAAATDSGSVHLISPDVENISFSACITEDGKVHLKSTQEPSETSTLPPSSTTTGCHINIVRPFTVKNNPVLVCGNRSGRLVGLDPRTIREAFTWKTAENIQHGPITALCGDEHWIVSGTKRGFLTLWDLRFQMPVLTWRMPSHQAINSLGVFKSLSQLSALTSKNAASSGSPSIYIGTSGSTEISLWNFEFQKTVRQFNCCDHKSKITISSARSASIANASLPVRKISSDSPPVFESKMSSTPSPPSTSALVTTTTTTTITTNSANPSTVVVDDDPYAIKELSQIPWDYTWDSRQLSTFEVRGIHVTPDGNFYSAGTDRKIRFWDMTNGEKSYMISGLEVYETCNYKMKTEKAVPIVQEIISTNREQQSMRKGAFNMPVATYHLDTITDVKLVGASFPLLVSCSRDGVIKLWK